MNKPASRNAFGWFCPITTRWHDNDIYGHVNNVTYYAFFDTAVNRYLIEQGGLDIHNGETIGFVVNSQCDYFKPIAYPQNLEVGLAVNKLGNSSVTYRLGIFIEGESAPAAVGSFVHVFVDRLTQKSAAIPLDIRAALATLTQS